MMFSAGIPEALAIRIALSRSLASPMRASVRFTASGACATQCTAQGRPSISRTGPSEVSSTVMVCAAAPCTPIVSV